MDDPTQPSQPVIKNDREPARRLQTDAGWPFDRQQLREMLANEADMSFKRRSEAVYDFLRIGPGHRVLDLGSGRGFYLRFTRELYPDADVIGVELDRPLLATARRQVPGSRLVNADAYDLPFPDDFFDRIIFSEVIEHILKTRERCERSCEFSHPVACWR